jgi:hypothetical protein
MLDRRRGNRASQRRHARYRRACGQFSSSGHELAPAQTVLRLSGAELFYSFTARNLPPLAEIRGRDDPT